MPRSTTGKSKSRRVAKKPAAKKSGSRARVKQNEPVANYSTALKFLHNRVDVERVRPSRVDPKTFDLGRMRALMRGLGDPQDSLRIVHIAGTNGKGSTLAMVASALRACGYAVGTYTSPHLTDVRERICINDAMIPHARFTESMAQVAEAAEGLSARHGTPTYFELLTAVALVHFAEQVVDVCVLETGLGGRLDATNIVHPEVSAVAGINLDHMEFLGGTVEEIAREKAGIFKKGVSAVTIDQPPEVKGAMREVAESVGAPLEVIGDDVEFSFRFEASPKLGPHTRVGLSTARYAYEHVPVPLPGEHQAWNCGLALAIIDKLAERGFEVPEPKILEGLSRTNTPGRMEMVRRNPMILLDGAHNPSSMKALIRSIGAHITYDSMIMIFGCAADKDVEGLLDEASLGADKVIFTRAKSNPRAMDPHELSKLFKERSHKMHQVADSLDDAIASALRGADREDMVCIAGSFYLVGEAKKHLRTD